MTPAELDRVAREIARRIRPPLAYSAREAATVLRVSDTQVRRLVRAGLIAKVPHVGDRCVIAHAELERFISQGVQVEEPAA